MFNLAIGQKYRCICPNPAHKDWISTITDLSEDLEQLKFKTETKDGFLISSERKYSVNNFLRWMELLPDA